MQDIDAKEKYYPKDSIVKAYNDQYRSYKLYPGDIISLRIGSLTPAEFNFVSEYEQQLGLIRRLNQYDQGQSEGAAGLNQQRMFGQSGSEGEISAIFLDRLNTGFILDELGALEMPKIGSVNLNGLDLNEAEEKIKSLLTGYFETPIVRVQLLSFQFTVLGEVNKEGRYTSFDPRTNIFDAIVMAGNLTEFADRSNIKIIRTISGEAMVIYINTLDQNTLMAENLYLFPNDMIVVAPLPVRYWRRYLLPSTGTVLSLVSTAISVFLLINTIK